MNEHGVLLLILLGDSRVSRVRGNHRDTESASSAEDPKQESVPQTTPCVHSTIENTAGLERRIAEHDRARFRYLLADSCARFQIRPPGVVPRHIEGSEILLIA